MKNSWNKVVALMLAAALNRRPSPRRKRRRLKNRRPSLLRKHRRLKNRRLSLRPRR